MVIAKIKYLVAAEIPFVRCDGALDDVFGTFAFVSFGVLEVDDERFSIFVDDDIMLSKVTVLDSTLVELQKMVHDV